MRYLKIVYFAWVQERLGRAEERLELPGEIMTIAELLWFLSEQAPDYQEAFSDSTKLRFALDQEFAQIDASLLDAEELAIFPPVTGG